MKVDQLASTVVALRQERGLHPRRIQAYERQAKRLKARYLDLTGGLDYDAVALAKAVEDFRSDFERGLISEFIFRDVRRVAADIEDLVDYGAIGNDLLPKWGEERNPLNRPVSEAVKRDPDNVIGLAARALQMMGEQGYSQNTINCYKKGGFPCLIRYFLKEGGSVRYSDNLLDSYLAVMGPKDKGLGGMPAFRRVAALHVRSVRETGELHERADFGAEKRASSGPFAEVFLEYAEWSLSSSELAPATAGFYLYCIACILCELQSLGLTDLALITREDVRAARATYERGKSPAYVRNVIAALRSFARFTEEAHPEIPPFANWIGRAPRMVRKMPMEGYSREQSDGIVASVDRSRKAGLRDVAMMTMGKNLGLRGVDIRHLRLSDIDWRENRVSVTQSKTGRVLCLPLDKETGEAVAKYVLESRRDDCDDDTVFLTVMGRPGPVTRDRLHGIVRKHAEPVVGDGFTGLHGPHSFRRGLGKSMVEAGVRLEDAAEVLGHANVGSTDPYVAVAFERMAACAAGLDDVPTDRIWWLR